LDKLFNTKAFPAVKIEPSQRKEHVRPTLPLIVPWQQARVSETIYRKCLQMR